MEQISDMSIGQIFRFFRKSRERTQKEIAGQLKCHISHISRIESGEAVPSAAQVRDFIDLNSSSLSLEEREEIWGVFQREVSQKSETLVPSSSKIASSLRLAPFVAGPPIQNPSQFFGRGPQLKRIYSLLSHNPLQHAAVIGPKRSGKTSLLHYLKAICATSPEHLRQLQKRDWLPEASNYRWAFVDFQDSSHMREQELLLQHILQSLRLPVPPICSLRNFMDIVSSKLVSPAVILFDEIEIAFKAPGLNQEALWESLRSLVCNSSGGQLGIIITCREYPQYLQSSDNPSSPFLNIFAHSVEVGPFSEGEARALIASAPRQFSSEDETWIWQTSGGWPICVQLLCLVRLERIDEPGENWKQEGLRQIAKYQYLLDGKKE